MESRDSSHTSGLGEWLTELHLGQDRRDTFLDHDKSGYIGSGSVRTMAVLV